MFRNKLFVILAVIIPLCCISIVAVVALEGLSALRNIQSAADVGPASQVGDDFMAALRDGNYAKGYGLCTPDLQEELGSANGLKELVEGSLLRPTKWSFTSRTAENGTAQLAGGASLTGERESLVGLFLLKIGKDWKVAGFNIDEL